MKSNFEPQEFEVEQRRCRNAKITSLFPAAGFPAQRNKVQPVYDSRLLNMTKNLTFCR